MSQITGLIDGSNVNHDYQVTALANSLINSGVISGLLVTTNSVALGEAFIPCIRTNGQVIIVHYQNTAAVTIDTSGTKKVWIGVDQGIIDNGSSNALDGTGIATIQVGASYPSGNYLPLASITGGVITDERVFITQKPVLKKGFPLNKVVYVDPATGADVVKDTLQVSTFNDSDVILGRRNDGSEVRGSFSEMKNQLSSSGKYIKNVALGEMVGIDTASIPTMTSNSQGGYLTSAFENTSLSFQAFDGNVSAGSAWGFLTSGTIRSGWLKIQLPAAKKFTSFEIKAEGISGDAFAVGWKIQGSNDDSYWTDLYTDSIGVVSSVTKYAFQVTGTFLYYRFYGTKANGTIGNPYITWLQFYETQDSSYPTAMSIVAGSISFINTLGSNIAGSRIKSGIGFKPEVTDVLGRVYVGQNATSTSARIQLLSSTGTLIAEKTPSIGVDYADFPESVTKNIQYYIVLNDSNYFNAQNNELPLATYQANCQYCTSGYLNGDTNVNPQAIRRIDFGTTKAVRAKASGTQEYANIAGFLSGTNLLGDNVELNANDGVLVSGFSGLTPLSKYYVSNISGVIGTTPGTISRIIGMAVSATELYLSSAYYPGTNVTKP